MADGGRSGVEELDPMEDIKRSVDDAIVQPGDNGQPVGTGAPTTDGHYLDSERNDPPVHPGDTD
jgi:hypothetical protein